MRNPYQKLLSLLLVLCLVLSYAFTAAAVEEAPEDGSQPSVPCEPSDSQDPADIQAPVIYHTPIQYGDQNAPLLFQAIVTDDVAVTAVELVYRMAGNEEWLRLPMEQNNCDSYTLQLEATAADRLEYYLEASDGSNAADTPRQIILLDKGISVHAVSLDRVELSKAESTPVTLTGEGFTPDMKITVGGVEAAYTYVSETEVTLSLPALGVCRADLVITGGENGCTRLEAITYEDPMASVKLSAPAKVFIGQRVGFPVYIHGSAPVTDAYMQFKLDLAYFSELEFVLETTLENVTASCQVSPDGLVTVHMAGAESMVSEGPVGYILAYIPYTEQVVKPVLSVETALFQNVPVHGISCDVIVSNHIQIQVLHMSDLMYAVEGSAPDYSAWELEIDYEGVCSRIPVTDAMVSISREIPGEGKVSYFHLEVPFTFTVLEKEHTRLLIQTMPESTACVAGQEPRLEGLELVLSYKDDELVIPAGGYTISGFDPNVQGVQQITLSCQGLSTGLEITVFARGDINMDGRITLLDMMNVKSHVLGTSRLEGSAGLAADYNGDGKISILDYVQIKAVILGFTANDEGE